MLHPENGLKKLVVCPMAWGRGGIVVDSPLTNAMHKCKFVQFVKLLSIHVFHRLESASQPVMSQLKSDSAVVMGTGMLALCHIMEAWSGS